MLFNEPKLLKFVDVEIWQADNGDVSVLFNEPKLLKSNAPAPDDAKTTVSVLFNEPKLLKCCCSDRRNFPRRRFSALQRAEIAEIELLIGSHLSEPDVSVLFNEPKLLKYRSSAMSAGSRRGFSALQRAEIAEIVDGSTAGYVSTYAFQCSSTSRNC